MPVPIEAKRTVSLGGTARAEADSKLGSSSVTFAAAVAATAPVPIWMNWRRVSEFLSIRFLPPKVSVRRLRNCGVAPACVVLGGDYAMKCGCAILIVE